jgi:hypothetical protein
MAAIKIDLITVGHPARLCLRRSARSLCPCWQGFAPTSRQLRLAVFVSGTNPYVAAARIVFEAITMVDVSNRGQTLG